MTPRTVISAALLILGGAFFLAGTLGLLRFPDVYSRLHALTKADNLGLGFVAVGLSIEAASFALSVKVFIVWASVVLASGISSQLIAGAAFRAGVAPAGKAPPGEAP